MKVREKIIPIGAIKDFINIKDNKKRYTTLKELIDDGVPTLYCFRYTVKGDRTKKLRVSKRIRKLDLFNKEILTTDPTIKYQLPSNIEV